IRPILGRGFRPEEGTGRNAHPVTVISYMTWKNRYKGDPDIVGKMQYMNGVQHTIIGVAPEKFHGTFIGYSFNFWIPTSMQETFDNTGYKLEDRGARWIEGYAFLKPGVTQQQAHAELSAIAKRIAAARLGCYRCGKRRSTRQAEFRRRSASPRPSFSLSSSSLAPTSATCFSRDHSYAGTK